MDIKFSTVTTPKGGAIVIGVTEELTLRSDKSQAIDKMAGGAISRALTLGTFKGKKGDFLNLHALPGIEADTIMLVGLGSTKDAKTKDYKPDFNKLAHIAGTITSRLNASKIKEAAILVESIPGMEALAPTAAAHIGFGCLLKSYRFDKYRTKEKAEDLPTLHSITIMLDAHKEAEAAFAKLEKIAEGVFLTRDVVTEPPNVIYPESLAERCKTLTTLGVEVEIFDEKEMHQLGMGALLGVGQGSVRESRLVIMRWNGASDSKEQPIAFVGKGVTFDTGGISLKSPNGMEDMKYDMGGSGVVIGLMKALAGRKAKVNAVGVVGLVENMPGGNAQRPSDVVTSMSGQTIEVLNTDAEGRLVLADALWYCQDRFKPRFMVDLATLTGAISITFGHIYAGLFSNDDELSNNLLAAGLKVDEKLWRLPLAEAYDKFMNSEIADMQNIGNEKGAGSITAAQFLKRFVNDVPWAHLDIAGVTWSRKDTDLAPKGATAFGVRLLNQLVEDHYEK